MWFVSFISFLFFCFFPELAERRDGGQLKRHLFYVFLLCCFPRDSGASAVAGSLSDLCLCRATKPDHHNVVWGKTTIILSFSSSSSSSFPFLTGETPAVPPFDGLATTATGGNAAPKLPPPPLPPPFSFGSFRRHRRRRRLP